MKMKPISQIKANLGINPNGRVQRFFTDACYRKMDKYVPMDTGNLRNIVDKGIDYITYEMPYAHAQYIGEIKGTEIKKYTTAGTGPYWDKKMWTAEGQDVVKEVQNYVNRGR